MQKLTAQHLSEAIAQQLGLSKKISDSFVRAFVDTITEGLFTDGVVKVKGLGTFKAVNVEDRESISVKTGERIIIPGFKKLSFSPEDSLADKIGTVVIPISEVEEAYKPTQSVPQDQKDEKEEKPIFEEKPVEKEVVLANEAAEQKVTPLKSEVTPSEQEVSSPALDVDIQEPEAEVEADDALKKNYDTPSATLVSELPKDEAPIKGEVPQIEEEEKEEEEIERSPLDKLISDEELSYKKFLDSLTDEELDQYLAEKEKEPMDDKFSGIDGVIATPESLNELKEKLKEAISRFETAKDKLQDALDKVNIAKDAVRTAESNVRTARIDYETTQHSVQSLEKLISNVVENDKKPAEAEKAENSFDAKIVDKEETTKTVETPAEQKPVFTAPSSNTQAQPTPSTDENKPKGFLSRPVLIGLAALALIVLAFFIFKPKSRNIENPPVETENMEQQVAPQESTQPTDELEPGSPAAIPEQAKPDEPNAAAPQANTSNGKRPRVHVLEKGEYLTLISVRYYGTKDSVDAILRLNKFENPDVIEPGTEIKLP